MSGTCSLLSPPGDPWPSACYPLTTSLLKAASRYLPRFPNPVCGPLHLLGIGACRLSPGEAALSPWRQESRKSRRGPSDLDLQGESPRQGGPVEIGQPERLLSLTAAFPSFPGKWLIAVVQSLSRVQLLGPHWTAASQSPLSSTIFWK